MSMEFNPRRLNPWQSLIFKYKHGAPPEEVNDIQEMLLEDKRKLSEMISSGKASEKHLYDIKHDPETQKLYLRLMQQFNLSDESKKHAAIELYSLPEDLIAGWLVFRREYFEKELKLKLISDFDD